MTWVKICGTTNLEDALVAVDAGADAVGFVFYDKSPRKISDEAARAIAEKLPEHVEKVGVFVGNSEVDPFEVLFAAGLTGLQTYPSSERGAQPSALNPVGVSCLPERARFLMALPMNQIGSSFCCGIDRIADLSFIGSWSAAQRSQPSRRILPSRACQVSDGAAHESGRH